jgi:tRNA threonylcarbamoyladenosine biosynthesis protein TsaB
LKILGIETSTLAGGIALMSDAGLIAEYRLHVEIRHSERILIAVDHILTESQTPLSDLDAIAVSIGPGSFTGLRVGLATAKGLLMAIGKPIVLVTTLEAMAASFPYSKMPVVPLIHARKDEVYWSLFDLQEGLPRRLHPDAAASPEEMLNQIAGLKEVLFVGDGALKRRDLIVEKRPEGAFFPPRALQFPSAAAVAELGLSKLSKGETTDPAEAVPLYLKASTAELKWKTGEGKMGSDLPIRADHAS